MKRLSSIMLVSCALLALPAGAQSAVDVTADSATVRVVDSLATPSIANDSATHFSVYPHPVTVFRLKPGMLAESADVLIAAPNFEPLSLAPLTQPDTGRRRAVRTSEWYGRRLAIHRYGSYAMLPLFVTQFVLGNKLLNQKEDQYAGKRLTPIDKNLRNAHIGVGSAVGLLFISNTTTGVWNYLATRHNVEGRKLRTIHALTMLLADAGFAYTGLVASKDATDHGPPEARKHRNLGLGSMAIATAGASLMWFRRD